MSPTGSQENSRIHLIAEGHVQGVGFRTYVLYRAEYLNLTGWVRNLTDGNIEITAEGPHESLEALSDYVETGPRGSFVVNMEKQWGQATGEFATFEILRTE